MKNVIQIISLAGIISWTGAALAAPDYVFNQKAETVLVKLQKQGFTDIKITGQKEGYCTIAEDEFDFNAALFTAHKGDQKVKGVVCNNNVYITHSVPKRS